MKFSLGVFVLLFALTSFGQKIIPGEFDVEKCRFRPVDSSYFVNWFVGELATFSKNGFFGVIDKKGQVICPAKYDFIYDFDGEVAKVALHGTFGLINKKGQEILPPHYQMISACVDGYCRYSSDSYVYQGLVKSDGTRITESDLQVYKHVGENRYIYRLKSEVGILLTTGKKIPLFNLNADPNLHFSELGVRLGSKDQIKTTPLLEFQEGFATTFEKTEDGILLGFINRAFETAIPCQFDGVKPFKNGYAPVCKDSLWGLIDTSGMMVIAPVYQEIRPGQQNRFVVKENGKFGLINLEKVSLIAPKYKELNHLFEDLYGALEEIQIPTVDPEILVNRLYVHEKTHKWRVIHESGEDVMDSLFDALGRINDSVGIASKITRMIPLPTGMVRYWVSSDYFIFSKNGILNDYPLYFEGTIGDGKYDFDFEEKGRMISWLPSFPRDYNEVLPVDSNLYLSFLNKEYDILETLPNGFKTVRKKEPLLQKESMKNPDLEFAVDLKTLAPTGKIGVVDAKNQIVIPCMYDWIQNDGLTNFIVRKGTKYQTWETGIVHLDGTIIFPLQRETHIHYNSGLYRIQRLFTEWEETVVDLKGKMLVPFLESNKVTNGRYRIYSGIIRRCDGDYDCYIIDKRTGQKIMGN